MTSERANFGMFSKTWFVILLATLLVSGITAKLGFWQLGRAQTKEALNAITVARQLEPALLNDDWASGVVPEDWMQRSADLDGQWLPQFTVYLDNRQMIGPRLAVESAPLTDTERAVCRLVASGAEVRLGEGVHHGRSEDTGKVDRVVERAPDQGHGRVPARFAVAAGVVPHRHDDLPRVVRGRRLREDGGQRADRAVAAGRRRPRARRPRRPSRARTGARRRRRRR